MISVSISSAERGTGGVAEKYSEDSMILPRFPNCLTAYIASEVLNSKKLLDPPDSEVSERTGRSGRKGLGALSEGLRDCEGFDIRTTFGLTILRN